VLQWLRSGTPNALTIAISPLFAATFTHLDGFDHGRRGITTKDIS
jgi:hypothetical protein